MDAMPARTLRDRLAGADALLAPILLFVCLYVGSFLLLSWMRFAFVQWTGLLSVSFATAVVLLLVEEGRWTVGLSAPPRRIFAELGAGALLGAILIASCAAVVALTTDVRHARGAGFPWFELLAIYLPAVVHEELLFRGYAFQKLYVWRRWPAILVISGVFAALHLNNAAVSALGLFNIFLGGILLSLAYERHLRLWFPIGLHLAWNVMTGPVLGHEVSGYESMRTVLVERGYGPAWATGGEFGIEASLWMTLVEGIAVVFLVRRRTVASNMIPTPKRSS